ncbi:MAG: PTS sugar transporter subunit IIC [Merdibacter sp.]
MLQGFLVALVATLIYMESRIGGQHMLDRPILIGPIVGLIMGDFTMGLIIGGNLELVWMGLVGIGTSAAGCRCRQCAGPALAMKPALPETTLALAIPRTAGSGRFHRRRILNTTSRTALTMRRQGRLEGR